LKKFGNILNSHPAGREAWLFTQAYILPDKKKKEKIEIDFSGVSVLSPSWADEFIPRLKKNIPSKLFCQPAKIPPLKRLWKLSVDFSIRKRDIGISKKKRPASIALAGLLRLN